MAKLKVKFLNLSAGRPVAILHQKFAENSAIHPDDRVYIVRKGKKITAVVDTATGFLKKNEIAKKISFPFVIEFPSTLNNILAIFK